MASAEFLALRRRIIDREFEKLNEMQKKAVLSTEGPLLVLAGAGSGKTTVLVNRIANLIKFGRAYHSEDAAFAPTDADLEQLRAVAAGEEPLPFELEALMQVDAAKPWEILAITFTNKAAGELKSRLEQMLGAQANDIWASTFHSACVRILRRNADKIGFSSNFTIYDTDDSKRVLKDCMKALNISDKMLPPKTVLSEIGRAKDVLISPDAYTNQNYNDIRKRNIGELYAAYQQRLHAADAMDFDDIILFTVQLLEKDAEVRSFYQRKFRYVLVDEYQDTNHAQYLLTALLAGGHRNICVVGDDDQSIYKFRGATIENILSFEEQYPNATVIRLEQNYRSTQTILDAANHVIANNENRKGKNLWTKNGRGEKIESHLSETDRDEGLYIADQVMEGRRKGRNFSDFAVLYRMNSQSNLVEQSFVRAGIPYRIIGGHKFYDRKEIKDALAYLSVIANPNDTVRLQRIINEPKRGIGDASVAAAQEIAEGLEIPFFDVLRTADQFPRLSRSAKKMMEFSLLIDALINESETLPLQDLLARTLEETHYIESLDAEPERKADRLANLEELSSNLVRFQEENEGATLNDFLQEVSLMTDIDNYNAESDTVVMMTIHSAKGLEFPVVFLAGMEETIFPSNMGGMASEAEIEEERRLAYVGITRAKERLYLTRARMRMLFGSTKFNPPSRFLEEIPASLIHETGASAIRPAAVYRSPFAASAPQPARPQPVSRGFSTGAPKPIQRNTATFHVGDTVLHKAYGEGVILSARPMGNDTLLEIAFTNAGTKKIMANYAKVEVISGS
ncbi:MAG: UvrD-helicase domain-containing protein [Clostridia bacterium]|nr:UvrD-helicase domain-containing protein [Clostridia bacterium]